MSSIDLTEMLSLLAYRLSAEGMSVRFEPPEEHLFVMGHLDALERVVRNLLSNAQDSVGARAAMDIRDGKGGRHPEEGDPEPIQIDLIPSESGVEIRVRDHGTGIPEEALSRIWEPEFTMKRKRYGAGLGDGSAGCTYTRRRSRGVESGGWGSRVPRPSPLRADGIRSRLRAPA